jgi:hypothetical protein
MEVSGQPHAPAALPPGKEPLLPTGDWVGPRAGLDDSFKIVSELSFTHTLLHTGLECDISGFHGDEHSCSSFLDCGITCIYSVFGN